MPLVSDIQAIKLSPFDGGDQDVPLSGLAEPGGLVFARNVDVDASGQIQRGLVPSAMDEGVAAVGLLDMVGLSTQDKTDGTFDFVAATETGPGSTLYWTVGGTTTSGATSWPASAAVSDTTYSEHFVPMLQTADKVYATCRRTTNPRAIAMAGTDAAVTASDFDGTAARFPRAAHLAYHQSLVFAANVQYVTASAIHNSRLHWSNLLLPETWDAADYIDFDPGDGQEITGIIPLGDDLLVFKNSKVFLLAGRSEASFTVYRLTDEYGTRSPRSIVTHDGIAYFADAARGLISFDGSGFTVISDPIREKLFNMGFFYGLTKTERRLLAAAVVGDYVYFNIPENGGDSHERSVAYDTVAKTWTLHDFGFADSCIHSVGGVAFTNVDDPAAGSVTTKRWYMQVPFFGTTTTLYSLPTFFSVVYYDDFPGATIRTPWYVFTPADKRGRVRRFTTVWQLPRGAASSAQVRMFINGERAIFKEQDITLAQDTDLDFEPRLVYVHTLGGFSSRRFESVAFEIEFTGRTANEHTARFLAASVSVSFDSRGRGPRDIVPLGNQV